MSQLPQSAHSPDENADDMPHTAKISAEAPADTLDYIADMIGELQTMTAQLGCGTLAGILALALAEAKHQAARAATNPHH